MNISLKTLQEKIKLLEGQLEDARNRLPAHSVKPTIMHEIFNLEDELETLYRDVRKLIKTS